MAPSATSRSAQRFTTGFAARTRRYITGCVKFGSSVSLWPCLRQHHMSTKASSPKAARHSAASRAAKSHASGSPPFTWNTGASTMRATLVQYGPAYESRLSVVKPTWLLITTCTVPPTS